MDNKDKDTSLNYTDGDGAELVVEGCNLTLDKAGRYWLWSEQLEHNLAHSIKTKEDALLCAIDSLLFTIHLKDERLKALDRVNKLALQFADEIKLDVEDDRDY